MVASIYGVDEEKPALWVFLEHWRSSLEGVSLELLSKGRQLADEAGWPLVGLLLGHKVDRLAGDAFSYGADQVWVGDDPLLADFTVEAYARVVYQAVAEGKPSILLFGATPNGRDLAGRLAVRLRTGLNADCTDLRIDPGRGVLTCEVSGFGGGVLALLESPTHRPQMATVRPGVFPKSEPSQPKGRQVVKLPVDVAQEDIKTRVVEESIGEGVDLTQAEVLVCGGRGVEGNFAMLEDLCQLVGGEVGATRPPVDDGYIERERQVGQTGVVCRPKVAMALGISGAFHFVVGIQNADVVVAVNADPEAPIFEFSDYCIVGDVSQVVPALIETLRSEREVARV